MKIRNEFAEVAGILRGIKRRQDEQREKRTSDQAANTYRSTADTTYAYDSVTVSTGEPGFEWGVSEWGFGEWTDE